MLKIKVGDKVTIWRCEPGKEKQEGVTEVVAISARMIKTKDGRRWNARRMREVSESGRILGWSSTYTVIREYKIGDEDAAARAARLANAWRLLDGYDWEVRRDFALLSDDDLETLAAIADRLGVARRERDDRLRA